MTKVTEFRMMFRQFDIIDIAGWKVSRFFIDKTPTHIRSGHTVLTSNIEIVNMQHYSKTTTEHIQIYYIQYTYDFL